MGSGKGSIESWAAVVKSGTVFLEILVPQDTTLPKKMQESKSEEVRKTLENAAHKSPVKCKVVEKNQPI